MLRPSWDPGKGLCRKYHMKNQRRSDKEQHTKAHIEIRILQKNTVEISYHVAYTA